MAGLQPEHSQKTPRAIYRLSKTSLTTPEACGWAAKALGVPHGQVDYAGLKDKHAQTTQLISLQPPAPAAIAKLVARADGPGWAVERLGWSGAPANAEAITGNRFTIVVRDLTRDSSAEMGRRATALRVDDAVVFTNYFGDQRFGSARHGKGFAAAALVKGDFETALKLLIATPARKDAGKTRTFTRHAIANWGNWKLLAAELPRMPERRAIETLARGGSVRDAFASLPYFLQQMSVEAYQSHLWNATARKLAEQLAMASPPPLTADDDFGLMVFPTPAALSAPWSELQLPLLAPESTFDPLWEQAARDVLGQEGLTLAKLVIPGLRRPYFGEALRPLFAKATNFSLSPAEPDEMSASKDRLRRTASFQLGRGSYATVVLRALGQ